MGGNGWSTLKVAELIESGALRIDDGYRVRNVELGPAGIPFVRGGDIGFGPIDTNVEDHIRPEFAERVQKKLAEPWDVAFISKGTVGRVGMLRPGQPNVVFAPQVCFWRSLDSTQLNPQFLFYLLHSNEFRANLHAVKTHGSMVADYVSMSDQRNFRLTIPPIKVQDSIAEILGALDAKIELNRRMNQTLESLAAAIFKSWFVDFDPVRAKMDGRPPPGLNPATAALFPDSLKHVNGELIPTGWQIKTLEELTSNIGSGATPRGGSKVYVNEGVALVRSQNVFDYDFVWDGLARITPDAAEALSGVALEPEDILFNITGASVLRTCVVDPSVLPARVNQHVLRIRANPGVSSRFLHLHLVRQDMKDHLIGFNAGATREAVTKGHLQSVQLIVPSQELMTAFADEVVPIYGRKHTNLRESETLAALRDTLLPKLLSGELRVGNVAGPGRHVAESVASA